MIIMIVINGTGGAGLSTTGQFALKIIEILPQFNFDFHFMFE